MAPIPIHTTSPIRANLPSHPLGASPSTAAARDASSNPEASTTPTRSTLGEPTSQSAQPGARPAAPQPTNTAASSQNAVLAPTPTISMPAQTKPPPPQPGAVPSPYSISPNTRPFEPAPPRPLDFPQPNQKPAVYTTTPVVTAMPTSTQTPAYTHPFQMQSPSTYQAVPTPVRSTPPAGVTAISTTPSYQYSSPNYSFAQGHQVQDLSHPPGYQQDHHTSFSDKSVESCQETDYRATLSPQSASRRGAGILGQDWTFGSPSAANDIGDNAVVKTALSWAKAAGKRLSMTEKQIWKTINGEDDGS